MSQQSKEYGQLNFTLPHDVVTLPSQGLFYHNKKKSIKVGYLTGYDENILMAGGENITYTLLKSKIYEPDVHIEELLEGDIEAILIFLRNTAFGPEVNLNLTDPKTGKSFETVVVLDELNIVKGIAPNNSGLFEVELPKSKAQVKLKPLTYGEILEIDRRVSEYPKGLVVPKITWRLSKEIVELNGSTDKGEISKFVEQMPILDSKFIRKFLNENEPKLDLQRTVKAPSGDDLTINVGLGIDFFRPFFGL